MFELKKTRPGVYHFSFTSQREAAYAFLRYQEYYESPFKKIHNKNFTLVEYINEYVKKFELESWSYPEDSGGFNIPVEVIKKVHDLGISDINCYDHFMLGIYGFIKMDSDLDKNYLIATSKNPPCETENDFLDHELTHAMYYTNEEYKKDVSFIMNSISDKLKTFLYERIAVMYSHNVIEDEINAYITTGEAGFFKKNPKNLSKELNNLRVSLKKLHKKYFQKWLKET